MHDVTQLVIEHDVPLAPLTTLGVGGVARFYARVHARAGARAAAAWAAERQLPVMVIGRGSNLLIADTGFDGLVVQLAIPGISAEPDGDAVCVTAGAGEDWAALVCHAVERGWGGIECLAGIPGTVGASPVQNLGAYGQEVCNTICRVEALDLRTGDVAMIDNAGCRFAYRGSRFRAEDAGRFLILGVTYRLSVIGEPYIHYRELELKLDEWAITEPAIADVHRAVLAIRESKSMVLCDDDPNTRSAGSFFTNAQLSEAQMHALDDAIARELPGARIPRFLQPDGIYKAPAAWLIERAGFHRGYVAGPVGLSTNHALAIINRGGATAGDVLALARAIRDAVRDRFGVTLTPEPVFVGMTWE